MIVAKFGGTAVTPRNLIYLKRIATPTRRAIVVSAIGREYKEDVKATDLLLGYFEERDERLWQVFADKYRRLAEVNGIKLNLEELLCDAHLRATRFDKTYCASLGEELSARLVAAYLGATYIEAERAVRFDDEGNLLFSDSCRNIEEVFNGVGVGVMGGFYGGCPSGRRTFTRGGGDVTGALTAAALNASLYENWTDVNGVCVADPAKVHNVQTVECLGYSEMRRLSAAGAQVLHIDAVAPCEQRGIPIKIGNFFNPDGASTVVSACSSRNKLLSVAEKFCDGQYVTTVLHSFPQWRVMRLVSQFARSQTASLSVLGRDFAVEPSISAEFQAGMVRLYSPCSVLNGLYALLSDLR